MYMSDVKGIQQNPIFLKTQFLEPLDNSHQKLFLLDFFPRLQIVALLLSPSSETVNKPWSKNNRATLSLSPSSVMWKKTVRERKKSWGWEEQFLPQGFCVAIFFKPFSFTSWTMDQGTPCSICISWTSDFSNQYFHFPCRFKKSQFYNIKAWH